MNLRCRTATSLWIIASVSALAACGKSDSAVSGAGVGGSGGAAAGAGTSTAAGASAGGASGMANAAGNAPLGGASGDSGHAGSGGASGASGGGAAGMGGGAGNDPEACPAGDFCDGFETYKPGGGFGDWKTNGTSGTLAVDGTHVFGGVQSAHFHVNAGANQRLQLQRMGSPIFPAQNNAFWGRVLVWATDLPMMSDTEAKNVHYDVIQASGATPGEYRVAGMGGVLLNYEPHDCYYGTKNVIPQDRWACWEWLYDGTNNVIEFYIDGALQARVEGKGQGCVDGTDSVWQAPQFDALRIGWVNYQSKPDATDMWMDDFAVGPARVGCPAPQPGAH